MRRVGRGDEGGKVVEEGRVSRASEMVVAVGMMKEGCGGCWVLEMELMR